MRKNTKEEPKKMEEAFALWKTKAKSGSDYLTGKDLHGNKLVAFFNTNKKNPNEPDIRVYEQVEKGKEQKEVASLWENISKKEERYLTGKTSDKEDLVGFYDKEENEKRPFIKAYFKESE